MMEASLRLAIVTRLFSERTATFNSSVELDVNCTLY